MRTKIRLTQNQMTAARFIRTYIREHGVMPTRDRVREHMGFAVPYQTDHTLNALVTKGIAQWRGDRVAILPGVRLTEKSSAATAREA